MRRPRLIAGLILVTLAYLGNTFLRGRQDSTVESVSAQDVQSEDQGYVALDAVITETTASGEPFYTLTAKRMQQQPASGDINMETIAMRYMGDAATGEAPAAPWALRADHGYMRGGSTLVQLSGAVRVKGKPPGSQSDAQVDTDQLDFDTKTQDIATMANVTFTWAGLSVRSRGFRANLQQEHARLESSVHGRFTR